MREGVAPVPPKIIMRREHVALPASARFFSSAILLDQPRSLSKRLAAWQSLNTALNLDESGINPDIALADTVSKAIEARNNSRPKRIFADAVVMVGHQGSGKDYVADAMAPLGYVRITMSDIVKAVAPALGFNPDTTQGKIDAGHAMRRIFGKRIFTDLGFMDASERGARRVIMTGPRSSIEIRAAREFGARIISLVADTDKKKDRAIRLERVVKPRQTGDGKQRNMTKEDFVSRERQEKRRINRLMKLSDRTVVNKEEMGVSAVIRNIRR
ncbi:hypothetical protein HZB58_02315 [Candidatus Gottesmanbacteria bacterium]|nr:hypothetical protein [Candidatus Gottesmanbacteria bacterium]